MRKVICVDLDGTILQWFKGEWDATKYGEPVPGAKEGLAALIRDRWWVIIYTCRGDRNKVAETLLSYGIQKRLHYSAINRRKNVLPGTNPGKIGADVYLDDRNIEFRGDWSDAYKRISTFYPWSGK